MKKKILGILVCLTMLMPALSITAIANEPPATPTIDGKTNGKTGETYEYTFLSTDPDGDDLIYCFDWGDGSGEICIGPFPNGQTAYASHTWIEEGTYIIKAKATDIYEAESDWGYLEVTMPKNKPFIFNFNLLSWLFERFPYVFPILRQVLEI